MSQHAFRVAFPALLCSVFALMGATESSLHTCAASSKGFPRQSQNSASTSVPVYISDFELLASGTLPPPKSGSAAQGRNPESSSGAKDTPPAVYEDEDAPSVQARRLMDYFSITLVDSLKKSGYNASRRIAFGGSEGTGAGVMLSGVFTEVDSQNRIRRAILGGGAPGTKFLLYVGTFNLSRPNQPLYQVAPVQSSESGFGPVITLNAYLPLVKYEIPKNPSELDVRKVCDEIVRNLTTLLKANPSAFSH
jgi:hypothetical protein